MSRFSNLPREEREKILRHPLSQAAGKILLDLKFHPRDVGVLEQPLLQLARWASENTEKAQQDQSVDWGNLVTTWESLQPESVPERLPESLLNDLKNASPEEPGSCLLAEMEPASYDSTPNFN